MEERRREEAGWGDDRCGIENEDPPTGVVGTIQFIFFNFSVFLEFPRKSSNYGWAR